MHRDEMRQLVTGQFYQSIGESGVAIDAVPPEQLKAIVTALTDGMFAALATLEKDAAEPDMAETRSATVPEGQPGEERMLWRGRPYLTIGTRYELTNQRLRVLRGLLGNTIEEIELIRVRDTKVKQHMGERMLNVGDITVLSADQTTPNFILHNVTDPIGVREMIRKAVMDEKTRRGLRYREDLADESESH